MTTDEYIRQELEAASAKNFTSEEAETAVVGSILRRPDNSAQKLVTLREDDFYFDDPRKVFTAIKATAAKGQKIDFITVDATFSALYPADAKRVGQLLTSATTRGTTSHIDSYIRIVQELAARRRSIALVEQITAQLKDPANDINEVVEKLRAQTHDIADSRHSWESMADVLISTYEKLEKRSQGLERTVSSGLRNVDSLTGGFYPGELIIIGARPSVGKSAFGANIAIAAARQGIKVGIASREMTDTQFGQRLFSNAANVDGMKLRTAKLEDGDWDSLADSMATLADLPVSFLFSVTTVEDLRLEAEKKAAKGELELLIVDYLQLMRTTQRFNAEHLRVAYVSRMLKDIALDLQIPVIALAQVNRDTDGQMPTLKSLKDSGAIEQDADGVIFLHRPTSADDPSVDNRDRDAFHNYKANGYTYICIGVAKQRQGITGNTCTLFDSKHMRYIQISRDEPPGGGRNTREQQQKPNARPVVNRPGPTGEQLYFGY